jgi:hypothetical protein
LAQLIFPHQPNRLTFSVAGADTAWHQLAIPAGVLPASGRANITMTVATVATGGAAAGGFMLVDFDKATTPTVGFPVFAGQELTFNLNNSFWYKLATATDTLYVIFSF